MASKRLTQDVRDRIYSVLSASAVKIHTGELLPLEHKAALTAYAEIVTDAERRRWQRADPKGKWIFYCRVLSVLLSGGERDALLLPKKLPLPIEYQGNSGSHAMTFKNRQREEEVASFISMRRERTKKLHADQSAIASALRLFTTTAALRDGWPDAIAVKEVAEILADFETDEVKLPVDLSRINAAAGLPPRDQKKAA